MSAFFMQTLQGDALSASVSNKQLKAVSETYKTHAFFSFLNESRESARGVLMCGKKKWKLNSDSAVFKFIPPLQGPNRKEP